MFRKLFKIVLLVIGSLNFLAAVALAYITKALPDAGPAPDIRIEITPARWTRGKYLALYVAGCNNCHSTRDYLRYSGTWRTQPPGKETTHLNFPMSLIVHTLPQKAETVVKPDSNEIIPYGKYMLTAAHCDNCHSPMERGQIIPGQEFSGGRPFPVPGGIVTSANITPDKQTGIGAWTKEVFIARFRHSLDSNFARPLAPGEMQTVMPWTTFAHMTDGDLAAIFAYLQSVSPVKKAIKKWHPTK